MEEAVVVDVAHARLHVRRCSCGHQASSTTAQGVISAMADHLQRVSRRPLRLHPDEVLKIVDAVYEGTKGVGRRSEPDHGRNGRGVRQERGEESGTEGSEDVGGVEPDPVRDRLRLHFGERAPAVSEPSQPPSSLTRYSV